MWRSMPSTAVTSTNCLVSFLKSISPRAIGLPKLSDVEGAAEVLRRFARLTLSASEEAPGEEAGRDNEEGRHHHDRCDRVHRRQGRGARRCVDLNRDGVRGSAA